MQRQQRTIEDLEDVIRKLRVCALYITYIFILNFVSGNTSVM